MKIIALFMLPLLLALGHVDSAVAAVEAEAKESVWEQALAGRQLHGTTAVGINGKLVYSQSDGKGNSAQAQYYVGSVTKHFTAAALLRALLDTQCEGDTECLKRQLQIPVATFLPEGDEVWGKEQGAPEWAKVVTLDNLLSNTSGLFDFNYVPEYMEFMQTPHTRAEVVALFKDKALDFAPGTKSDYSNSNFFLAGVVVERLSGQTLGRYMQATFFGPLGMAGTVLPDSGTSDMLRANGTCPNLVVGYTYDIKDPSKPYTKWADLEWAETDQGEGGMISTVGDLIKWNHALYETERVLPIAARAIMLAPTALDPNYGYGIAIEGDEANGVIYSHNGLISGFISSLTYVPKHTLTLAQLSNLSLNPTQYFALDDPGKGDAIGAAFKEASEIKGMILDGLTAKL
ncbi:MAG: serine hydrolase domain-containing protein [Alphaproteobacteria bacterium]